MSYYAGIDIGSTMTKVVIADSKSIITNVICPTGPEHRRMANEVMKQALIRANLSPEDITYLVATGYGRINVPFADKQLTEIYCHARGTYSLFPTVRTVIDIGGQDCKGIKVAQGRVVNFVMNDKCAAGTGRFLERTAEALAVKLEEIGALSLRSVEPVKITSTCTIFAEDEAVARLAAGAKLEDVVAGLHESIASRICAMLERIRVEDDVVVVGGGAKNVGLIKALQDKLQRPLLVPSEPLLTGAIGAALLARELAMDAIRKGSLPVHIKERRLEALTFFAKPGES